MFRSGSTLQYQIASDLVERHNIGERITWHSPSQFPNIKKLYSSSDRIMVFKAHKLTLEMQEEVESGNARVITVHRDIRDVTVSAMRKNRWSFRNIYRNDRLMYWTSRFDQWSLFSDALVCRYEELVTDLPSVVAAIATQLGLLVSKDETIELSHRYSLKQQKMRTKDIAKSGHGQGVTKYDSHSLLHFNHISSGGIGVYKNVLKPWQVDVIENQCKEWMQRWGYPLDAPKLSGAQRVARMSYLPIKSCVKII